MKTLEITYDSKTQRGLVLRLRAQLGQTFKLRFRSIGSNGDKKEGALPTSIYHLPAEVLSQIVGVMVKMNPTKQDIKRLFSAAASTFVIREIIEDPGFENMISLRVLGIHHSRSREERRVGLEPNVAKRYRSVLSSLGFNTQQIKSFQHLADRNAEIYAEKGAAAYYPFITFRSDKELEEEEELKSPSSEKREGMTQRKDSWWWWWWHFQSDEDLEEEEEEEEELESSSSSSGNRGGMSRRISAWPWWYFRLLSNHMILQSMKRPFGPQSDGFFASVASLGSLDAKFQNPMHKRVHFHTDASKLLTRDFLHPFKIESFFEKILEKPSASFDKWQQGSAGADLMIIPMLHLVKRAAILTIRAEFSDETQRGPTHLLITAAEAMPMETPREGKASYRKEVVVLTRFANSNFDLLLILNLRHVYLGNSMVQFLNHLQPRPNFHLQKLKLEHVHFPNPNSPLVLSGFAKKEFSVLLFGPSNLSQVPKLSCPSSLKRIFLVATPKFPLRWSLTGIDIATCYPKLDTIKIKGNVEIWKSPLVEKIGKFPSLEEIFLYRFPGNDEDLLRLAANLQNDDASKTVIVYLSYDSTVGYDSAVLRTGVFGNVSFTFEPFFS